MISAAITVLPDAGRRHDERPQFAGCNDAMAFARYVALIGAQLDHAGALALANAAAIVACTMSLPEMTLTSMKPEASIASGKSAQIAAS